MPTFNRIILMGNLTRDPEMRYTTAGLAICNFDIAVNDPRKQDAEPLFIRIASFNKQAESCGRYLKKGNPVFVEGRLQISSWGEGEAKKSRPEVIAQMIQFLRSSQPLELETAIVDEIKDGEIPF